MDKRLFGTCMVEVKQERVGKRGQAIQHLHKEGQGIGPSRVEVKHGRCGQVVHAS
jgi:hypothetical protein